MASFGRILHCGCGSIVQPATLPRIWIIGTKGPRNPQPVQRGGVADVDDAVSLLDGAEPVDGPLPDSLHRRPASSAPTLTRAVWR